MHCVVCTRCNWMFRGSKESCYAYFNANRCPKCGTTSAFNHIDNTNHYRNDNKLFIDDWLSPDKDEYLTKDYLTMDSTLVMRSLVELLDPAEPLLTKEEQEQKRLKQERDDQVKRIQKAADDKKKQDAEDKERLKKELEEARHKRPDVHYPALRVLRRLWTWVHYERERVENYANRMQLTIHMTSKLIREFELYEERIVDYVSDRYGQCNLEEQYAEAQEYEILMEELRGKN
jgi:hypothetical protein